jgi:hypothetical protein
MNPNEPARAAVGALPPHPPATVQETAGEQAQVKVDKPESATAPTESRPLHENVDYAATAAALDPLAFVQSIKSLVSVGTKILGLVAKVPGPQQAAAQEALKLLDVLDTILSKF